MSAPSLRDWPIRTTADHHFVRTGRCPTGAGNPRFHQCSHYCPEPPPGLRRDRALAGPTDVDALSVVYVGQAAALLATRSGTLVPVTAGPACLVPGGFGVPDQAALAPVLARWSELADGHRAPAIDLRAWHAAATAVELRIPAADRVGITAAQVAELDRGLPDPPSGQLVRPGERAAELARLALEAGPASSTRASRRPSAPAWAPPRRATTSSAACSPGSTCSASRARTAARRGRGPAAGVPPRAARGTCWRPPPPAATPRG